MCIICEWGGPDSGAIAMVNGEPQSTYYICGTGTYHDGHDVRRARQQCAQFSGAAVWTTGCGGRRPSSRPAALPGSGQTILFFVIDEPKLLQDSLRLLQYIHKDVAVASLAVRPQEG